MLSKILSFITLFIFMVNVGAEQKIIRLGDGPGLHTRAQEAMITAAPGTIIEFPQGKFLLKDELIVGKSHITLRGQGIDKTILSFRNQEAGAQGILATGDQFVIEDMTIEDTRGDALKVEGANGVTIRRVKVEWTDGPSEKNGAYGLYPVQTRNVLIEDSIVIGASDAGVYVGQSRNIIVRRNRVEFNVAGIEIENSRFADVYENYATNNTAGILVFDLPNLKFQGGRQIRVFNNQLIKNNTKNFAPKGNIVAQVPTGTGFMIMANDDVEFFQNTVIGHKFTSVMIGNYLSTGIALNDPDYDPLPQRINVHDNILEKKKGLFINGEQFNLLANALTFFKIPEIIYDGVFDGTYNGQKFPENLKLCFTNNKTRKNKAANFANLHLDNQRPLFPFPGGPITKSLKEHDCHHDPLPRITLEDKLPIPVEPEPEFSEEEIARICQTNTTGVNWLANKVDCPDLASYNLFQNPVDPTQSPQLGGIKYDLTNALFSDYAEKDRFIFLPEGQSITYSRDKTFQFPIGTIITKTFSFPIKGKEQKPVETRLLIKRKNGWIGLPYVWNEAGTSARLSVGGGQKEIHWKKHSKEKFTYFIPSKNKCTSCHGGAMGDMPIGPKAKWLNKDLPENNKNQLEHWVSLGILKNLPVNSEERPSLPVWDNSRSGSLTKRTQAYLDINCAHCHNPSGRARFSGLFLESERDPYSTTYGHCKPPVAAGSGSGNRKYDIVPGKPKESIITFRMNHKDPSIMMPELGRTLVHKEGVKLVKRWIKEMPTQECQQD